jgi:FkbM family methyltransferase
MISILKYITNHPLNRNNKISAILRFLKWQINTRLNPFPVVYPFTEKSKLIISKGMTGATGNLYCGLHEYNDMFFLLHFLRKDDLFIDIGANVGSYTVLASAHVGARSITFEPVPVTYSVILQNIYINKINELVKPLNIALGSKKDKLMFTSSYDTVNHVVAKSENAENAIEVMVDKLDNVLHGEMPSLIKIDVEGFETEVINGAHEVLNNEKLKAIIIELNGSGGRYGYNENEIKSTLRSQGFTPHIYDPVKRELKQLSEFGNENTIYIRDVKFVTERLKSADKVRVLNSLI